MLQKISALCLLCFSTLFASSAYAGEPYFDSNDTFYFGDFKKDIPNGKAFVLYENGDRIEGKFSHGELITGHTHSGADFTFDGQYKNFKIYKGKGIFSDGLITQGVWENDLFQGTFFQPNGMQCEIKVPYNEETRDLKAYSCSEAISKGYAKSESAIKNTDIAGTLLNVDAELDHVWEGGLKYYAGIFNTYEVEPQTIDELVAVLYFNPSKDKLVNKEMLDYLKKEPSCDEYFAAKFYLGMFKLKGWSGFSKSISDAVKLIDIAADGGNGVAMYQFALMNYNGKGVPQNLVESAILFKLAIPDLKESFEHKDLAAISEFNYSVIYAWLNKDQKAAVDAGIANFKPTIATNCAKKKQSFYFTTS